MLWEIENEAAVYLEQTLKSDAVGSYVAMKIIQAWEEPKL